ncbi:hypothetical protein PoB_002996700 [Plakobranchus ocellatus]|uniref:Secreted protein n=1 Tax=Plakobranchus ocellatus TaxID=259542 RepID=A0AAV4A985_9GAST|nr:hypothetical protein PoB_002996700 [Plakobranchus ocellatus]
MRLLIKLKLRRALMIPTVLYNCEAWTLTAALQRKAQAFENKCRKKVWFLCITSPQQGDHRLSGPLSGQGVSGGAQSHIKRVPADLRMNFFSLCH